MKAETIQEYLTLQPNEVKNFSFDSSNIEIYEVNIENKTIISSFSYEDQYGNWAKSKPIDLFEAVMVSKRFKLIFSNDSEEEVKFSYTIETIKANDKIVLNSPYIGLGDSMNFILDFGTSFTATEIQQNYQVNVNSPIEVEYTKVTPKMDSADHILGEFSESKIYKECKIRMVTPNNEVPLDESAEYTEWGYQFSSFEGFFSSVYFESKFGKGIIPQQKDYLKFSTNDRMFRVNSVTILEGVNSSIYGYKISLKPYDVDTSIEGIDLETKTKESVYFDLEQGNKDSVLDPQQNYSAHVHQDITRLIVSDRVRIMEEDDFNYYDQDVESVDPSIVYANDIDLVGKSFSISFSAFISSSIESKVNICSLGSLEIYVENSTLIVSVGDNINAINFDLLNLESWNDIVINYYFKERDLHIFIVDDGSVTHKTVLNGVMPVIAPSVFYIIDCRHPIRKIRVWKKTIPEEYMRRVIQSELVEKPEIAYIIDNCNNIINSRTHSRTNEVLMRYKSSLETHRLK